MMKIKATKMSTTHYIEEYVLLLVTARSVPNPTGTRSIELRSTVLDSYWSTKTYGNNYDVR